MAKNLEELRKELRLRDVIGLLTGSFSHSRNILCPFHDDTDPSLSVYRVKSGHDRFQCRSSACGKKGDVFDFIKFYEGFGNHREVLDWIQQHKTELSIGAFNYVDLASELDASYAKRAFWEKLEGDMQKVLFEEVAKPVREWLEKRGIDGKVLRDLPIGCFDHNHFVTNLGYTEKEFKRHGMPEGAGAYPVPALAFFYYSTPASLSRIKLRMNMENQNDRHLVLGNEIGPTFGMFGLSLLGESKLESLTCVEGEFDVLTMQSKFMLETNAVLDLTCMSGSTLASEQGFTMLSDLRLKRVRLWPDNDKAGVGWVGQGVKFLQMPGLFISVVWPKDYRPPKGKDNVDPADYVTLVNRDIRDVCKKLRDSEVYVAGWLATNACKTYVAKPKKSDEDFVRLQEELLDIASSNNLLDLTLANFLESACKLVKKLNYEVLWRCAVAGYSLEPPTRHSLGGLTYVSTSGGYVVEKPIKNGVQRVPVTDFRVKIKKWVSALDPGMGTMRTFAECQLLRAGMMTNFILTDEDMQSFGSFKKRVHGVDTEALMDSRMFRDHYDEIIRSLNRGAESVRGTLNLGLVENNDRYIMPNYCVEDGRALPNKDIPILLNTYTQNFLAPRAKTALVSDPELLKESANLICNEMLDIHTDQAALVTLMAHIVASPVVELLRLPRGLLFLEGAQQAGKTVASQIFMNLAWDYPLSGSEGNISFASTVNFVEKELSYFKGLPLLVDDAKDDVLSSHSVRAQVLRMIQAYYDRQGRGRLNSRAESKTPACIQGHLVITGESLPITAGSAFSRMIVMTLQRGGLDLDKALAISPKRKLLSYPWPHYIAYLQRLPELRIQRFAPRSLGRLGAFVDYQATSLKLYLDFLVADCALDPHRAQEVMQLFTDSIPRLTERNQQIQGSFDDATLFIDTLAQLIHADPAILLSQPGISVKRIGYHMNDEIVCLYPSLAIRQVGLLLDGRSFNVVSLGSRLKEAGYVTGGAPNGTTRPASSVDCTRARVWQVDKARLFEGLGTPDETGGPNFTMP